MRRALGELPFKKGNCLIASGSRPIGSMKNPQTQKSQATVTLKTKIKINRKYGGGAGKECFFCPPLIGLLVIYVFSPTYTVHLKGFQHEIFALCFFP